MATASTVTYPDLAGRTVFVSGGGSGIGAAFVARFAGQGCRVAFIDIADAPSEALAAQLGDNVRFIHCDVRDVPALRAAVESVEQQWGAVRVLVNNAARDDRHRFEDVTPEYWDENLATNLRHHFFRGPGGRARDGRGRRWRHHQSRLGVVDARAAVHDGVRDVEGRDLRHDARAGARAGRAQHPRQRHRARRDRHRTTTRAVGQPRGRAALPRRAVP